MPENLGPVHLFTKLFNNVLPAVSLREGKNSELLLQLISAIISITGIYFAYRLFYKKSALAEWFRESRINAFFLSGWRFDSLYDALFVKPVVWLSEIDKKDFVDLIYTGIAAITNFFGTLIPKTQNGRLRWYVLFLAAGIVVILTVIISL
jgi:NADH-quinone oxidoreductase subunit L